MTFGLIPINMRHLADEAPPRYCAERIGREILGWSWGDFLADWDPVNNEAHAQVVWYQLEKTQQWHLVVQLDIGITKMLQGTLREIDVSKANCRYYELRSRKLTHLICHAALCTLERYEDRYYMEFGEVYVPTETNWQNYREKT